jgi:hypothetical protein
VVKRREPAHFQHCNQGLDKIGRIANSGRADATDLSKLRQGSSRKMTGGPFAKYSPIRATLGSRVSVPGE